MTAQEAREIASDVEQNNLKDELAKIEGKIRQSANNGGFAISINNISIAVRKKLEERGFKIKIYDGDFRESGYFTISW